jgi:hypothetical protein
MALFYPRQASGPSSELNVWNALARLDDSWRVFHSVVWQSARGGKQGDGEADFLLVHPSNGIVVLEVKGGRLEMNSGDWHTTDRNGAKHRIKDPFRQAKDSKYALLEYLRTLTPRLQNVPRICHGVVFPDIVVDGPIGLFPRELVLDCDDLRSPSDALHRLLTHWEQNGTSPVSTDALELITDRLAPTLFVRRTLRAELVDTEREILSLTSRQIDVLRTLRSIRRCVVRGGAGTGKTVLATEKARAMSADGARVLLCCFNAPLADSIARALASSGVVVSTFHSLCMRHAKHAGFSVPREPSDEWWDRDAARVLEAAAAAGAPRFDAVVVDEAQDFAPSWIAALDALTNDPGSSPYYLFTDSHQQVYRRGDAIPATWPAAELDLNCRNTQPIARAVAGIYGDSEPTLGARGRDPVFMECQRGEEASLVQSVVDRLLTEEGLSPSQVAVLCERRELVERLGELIAGGHPFVPLGSPGVLADTVHRFKGLEADVAVLVFTSEEPDDALLYVGVSRARSLLFVLGPNPIRRRLRMG